MHVREKHREVIHGYCRCRSVWGDRMLDYNTGYRKGTSLSLLSQNVQHLSELFLGLLESSWMQDN